MSLELAQGFSRVALALHVAGCSAPIMGNRITSLFALNAYRQSGAYAPPVKRIVLTVKCQVLNKDHPCGRGNSTTSDA